MSQGLLSTWASAPTAIAEWTGYRKLHKILTALTVGTVVFGITLSTLHQSALGALYLMAKPKVHPLWYSEFIPVLFFVSSIFAGMAMVIAALCAEGPSSIGNIRQIDRGYERIDERLRALGADIERGEL